MFKQFTTLIVLCLLLVLSACNSTKKTQTNQPDQSVTSSSQPAKQVEAKWIDPLKETKAQRDARMKWWREARFGMFIHWGVYSVPAGTYKDKQISGIGEWIMLRGKIPVAEYKAYAKDFNPVKYDADQWVKMAKDAGMKYIVITSKHHDGFALYDSKVTDWDIMDATPYKKDLLRQLETACKKHGIKLGFYYSQAQDWNHPGGGKSRYKEGNGWDEAHKGDFDEYLHKIAYPQVKEILSNYDISVLWWDTPTWMNKERAEYLRPLLKLKPGLITNNRLGGGYKGDTDTPEQRIPATGIKGRDWETCMTMNGTWGYKSYDHNWKPTKVLIQNLIDIASKGGNYLLNIGPKADGTFPDESIQRLKEVGQWMKVNGESIYATTASPCRRPRWGRITTKVMPNDQTRLYLNVFTWPTDGKLDVPVANQVKNCYLLADKSRKFNATTREDGMTIQLTGNAPDPISSVVVLDIVGKPNVVRQHIAQTSNGSVMFKAIDADIHNRGYGDHAKYESGGAKNNIGFWQDARSWVDWTFKVTKPGKFDVVALVATTSKTSQFTVTVNKQKLTATAPSTGHYDKYQTVKIGQVELTKTGVYKLSVKPVSKGWKPINLRSVSLKSVK